MLLRTDGGRSVRPRGRFRGVSVIEAAFILVASVLAVASIESRFSAGIGAVVAMVGFWGVGRAWFDVSWVEWTSRHQVMISSDSIAFAFAAYLVSAAD